MLYFYLMYVSEVVIYVSYSQLGYPGWILKRSSTRTILVRRIPLLKGDVLSVYEGEGICTSVYRESAEFPGVWRKAIPRCEAVSCLAAYSGTG